MCDEDGRRIPYMCGNNTSFNQKFRVCDWNYNVDCPNSPDWLEIHSCRIFLCIPVYSALLTDICRYYLNDLTYRTDPPPPEKERRGRSRDLAEQDFVVDEDNIRKWWTLSSFLFLHCTLPSFELNLLWDQLRQSQMLSSQQKSVRCKKTQIFTQLSLLLALTQLL